jgi:hypothetical protein
MMSFLTYFMGFFMNFGLLPILFWPFEEITIFSNGGAVGHNSERDPPRDHPC